jgi:NAD(P)-dependent dehydrogenase (short-subunit alcohol dehydrogenase family)
MNSLALITGATQGLGLALARQLDQQGWQLILTGRDASRIESLRHQIPSATVVPGDLTDPRHREELGSSVSHAGRLDLLVNNASDLGPSPLPALADLPLDRLRAVFETNLVGPLALTQLLLPALRAAGGTVLNVSSDAAVEAYEGWGGYGSSKAALDHLSAVLATEEPALRVYAVDPGDMRTQMHQRAFPGEDISDRPVPADVVPDLLRLLAARPASGRYRAADWAVDRAVDLTGVEAVR